MKKNWFKTGAALLTAGMLAVVPVSAGAEETDYSDITLTYALGSTWDNLNPYNVNQLYSIAVANKIFDQLAYVDSKHIVQPRAASSWEMEDDGYTIVFHLNENSYWHDGEKVTAEDWLFTFNLVSDPDFAGTTKAYLGAITGIDGSGNKEEGEEIGVEARDDYTLVLHLDNQTYAEEFITNNCRFYYSVLPEHLLADIAPADIATSDFWTNPVGSGPFRFESEIAGTQLTLTAFEDFYLGTPKCGTLIYQVVDSSNFVTSMAAGEIDATEPCVTIDEATSIDGLYDSIRVEQSSDTTFYGIFTNNEVLSTEVRQAMSLAIDKQLMVDQLALGKGAVADTCVSVTSPYHNSDVVFERDVEKAKEILAEAGWDSSTVVKMAVVGGVRERIGAIIQQNFAEAGITLEVTVTDAASMFSGLTNEVYDMIVFTTPYSFVPTFFKSYVNPDCVYGTRNTDLGYYNAFLEMQAEQDEDARLQLCLDMQAYLAEEVPFIPLYEEYKILIRSSRSEGITSIGTDEGWLWTAND